MPPANEPTTPKPRCLVRPSLALAALVLTALGLIPTRDGARHQAQRLPDNAFIISQMEIIRSGEDRLSKALFAIAPTARRSFELTATAYCPLCGAPDGEPQLTALDGRVVRPGRTVAVSQDLRHLLGRTVSIEGLGLRVVEDLMHPRHVGRLDLCLPDREQALAFGVKRLKVLVVN